MSKSRNSASPAELRRDLAIRLRARLPEIERAIMSRVRNVTERIGEDDPAYLSGLRSAISAALAYGIDGVEKGLDRPVDVSPAITSQARRAAREGVGLNIVLRRYAAGGRMLEDFILAESSVIPTGILREVLAEQGVEVDRLMAKVSAEYEDEVDRAARSTRQREAARIAELVGGDGPIIPVGFDFDFDLWHVGIILRGHDGERAGRWLAERFGYRLLSAARDEETVWVWFSSPRRSAAEKVGDLLLGHLPGDLTAAIGESRVGMDGWRLTHREARVALQVMLRRPQRLTRGRDVALLAAVLRNETLVRTLLDSYLIPLETSGMNHSLPDTLRAYFTAGGNAAAAAAVLGVTRHTVQRRIRTTEQIIGRPIHDCYPELVIALQVGDLLDR